MTEEEWNASNDAGAMLDFLWEQRGVSSCGKDLRFGGDTRRLAIAQAEGDSLEGALHRFYLASCRAIWSLLPQEESRRGVEMGEQYLAGLVSAEELSEYNFSVEGAAFCIDYNTEPESIERWVAEIEALPVRELRTMLFPYELTHEIAPRELLLRAAYFADYAMIYPSLTPKGPPPDRYRVFLSAKVLREHIGYPR